MKKSVIAIALLLAACVPPDQQNLSQSSAGSSATSSHGPMTEGDDVMPITGTGSYQANERLLASGMIEIGNANAPVSLVLLTNYSCAYCKEFQDVLVPRLITDFIRTDKIRISIVPFNLQKYTESEQSAGMVICAAQLGKGWPMHQLLFREKMNTKAFSDTLITLELDRTQLNTCAASDNIRATVAAQQAVSRSFGVNVVPSYFINGRMYEGMPEYADLRGQIEEAMK